MRDLKTKEDREHARRLVEAALKFCHREFPVDSGEGEGQGEVMFENFSILGLDDGSFSVSFAVEIPGTRDQPPDADVIEVGIYPTLGIAVDVALKTWAVQMIEDSLMNESLAQGEEEL